MAPKFDPQGAANFTFATTGKKVCPPSCSVRPVVQPAVQPALLLDLGHGRTMALMCLRGFRHGGWLQQGAPKPHAASFAAALVAVAAMMFLLILLLLPHLQLVCYAKLHL